MITELERENEIVQIGAAWVLGELGDRRGIFPLVLAFQIASSSGSWWEDYFELRERILDSLRSLGVAEPLIELLQDEGYDEPGGEKASWVINEISVTTAKPLIEVMKSENETARWWASRKLVRARAANALINVLLDNDDYYVGEEACQALGEIGDERVVIPLIEVLKDENEDWGVKENAIGVLRGFKDDDIVELLMKALKDVHGDMRISVFCALLEMGGINSMGKLKDERVLDPFIEALKDKNLEVRALAADELRYLKDKRMVAPLMEILQSEDREMRLKVVKSLGKIGGKLAAEPLLEALQDALLEALQDADEEVRLKASWVLGELGDERAIEPLREILKEEQKAISRATIKEVLEKLEKN